jgi:hypothetical protein
MGKPPRYYSLKAAVAEQFQIHPNEIIVVGSAKLGFSIAPTKRYRAFGETSGSAAGGHQRADECRIVSRAISYDFVSPRRGDNEKAPPRASRRRRGRPNQTASAPHVTTATRFFDSDMMS